ncbi:MAG TPA: DUF2336 domain-containing protein [Acetobacteraceae bacterium]|nr:DUF2336 domain-containing protein [Acetobacteraceae bacterium]
MTGPTLLAPADSGSAVVRAALALNPTAPERMMEQRARNTDERVRAVLARRLATLAPGLSELEQLRLQGRVLDVLARLVANEAEWVRTAIADAIKDMPDAPRELVLRLAHDSAISVSEPIIRFSPVLTEGDLLALLAAPPSALTARTVARRPELGETLADAIAFGEDAEAIRALLENPSAQIREATLDALIARAADHADWHAPLIHRPLLSPRSARALAEIVAAHMLETLAARGDLDAETRAVLRTRLQARLEDQASDDVGEELTTEEALRAARLLADQSRLDEAALIGALRAGRPRLATAMLAVAAVVPISVVQRAAALRSAKGLVSLLWSAGFTMRCAGALQAAIGHLSPAAMLSPVGDAGFPLSVEEMRWQLDFLRRTSS